MSNTRQDQAAIDSICDRFEAAIINGEVLDVEQCLAEVDERLREDLLDELIKLENELLPPEVAKARHAEYRLKWPAYESLIDQTIASTGESVAADGQRSQVAGNYKMLQVIGEGGMGTVYMAEQTQPVRRKVALKIIKSGLDSRQVIARFEAERQALAMMDHPAIARILDAGTTPEGLPYFAMELVNGVPLTTYCDMHRLNLTSRLKLFARVCDAVHHAHQKGIIHRDLKPSNILVAMFDGQPQPKIIDFGLARATDASTRLTDKTVFTEFGQVVGTIRYMSPEQATLDALDIDTRTDIYALGILLYELLTGSTPLDEDTVKGMAVLQLLELIREKEPPRPSQRLATLKANLPTVIAQRQTDERKLQTVLKGDLDWIVMRSLEKDRKRRYESAAEFAHDITRFVKDEPVSARPPTWSYRFSKWAKKHRLLVGSTTIVLLALLAGIISSLMFAWQANHAQVQTAEANLKLKSELVRSHTLRLASAAYQFPTLPVRSALFASSAARIDMEISERTPEVEAALCSVAQQAAGGFVVNLQLTANAILYDTKAAELIVTGESHRLARFSRNIESDAAALKHVAPVNSGKAIGNVLLSTSEHDPRTLQFTFPNGFSFQMRQPKQMSLANVYIDVLACACSPDRKHVLTTHQDFSAQLHTISDRGEILSTKRFDCSRADTCAFSSDGKWVAVGDDSGTVLVWNVQSSDVEASRNKIPVATHGITRLEFLGESMCLACTNNGQMCKFSVVDDQPEVLSVAAGSEVDRALGLRAAVDGLVVFYSGKRAVTTDVSGGIRLWQLKPDLQLLAQATHQDQVTSLSVVERLSRLVTTSDDHTVRVWDLGKGQDLILLSDFRGHESEVRSACISSDEREIYSVDRSGVVRRWPLQDRHENAFVKLSAAHSGSIEQLVFSEDGRWLISRWRDGAVRLMPSLAFGRSTQRSLLDLQVGGQAVNASVVNSQKDRLVVATADGQFHLFTIHENGVKFIASKKVNTASFVAVKQHPVLGHIYLRDSAGRIWIYHPSQETVPTSLQLPPEFQHALVDFEVNRAGTELFICTRGKHERRRFYKFPIDSSDGRVIGDPQLVLYETLPEYSTAAEGWLASRLDKRRLQVMSLEDTNRKPVVMTCDRGSEIINKWVLLPGRQAVYYPVRQANNESFFWLTRQTWSGDGSAAVSMPLLTGRVFEMLLDLGVSPDEKWIFARGMSDNLLTLLDNTFKPVGRFPMTFSSKPRHLIFSADSKWCAVATLDGKIYLICLDKRLLAERLRRWAGRSATDREKQVINAVDNMAGSSH